jgi:hypothetical protein
VSGKEEAPRGMALPSKSSSDDDSSDSNAAQPKTRKGREFSVSGKEQAIQARMPAPRGKDFFQTRFGMLPTANNRANNSIPRRLDTQFENHYIFTTVACHKLPEDMG